MPKLRVKSPDCAHCGASLRDPYTVSIPTPQGSAERHFCGARCYYRWHDAGGEARVRGEPSTIPTNA